MKKHSTDARPEPVPVNVVCSLCGEPWHLHVADANGDISTLECIRLLKVKASRPNVYINPTYPVWPQPIGRPYWYSTTISSGSMSRAAGHLTTINAVERTPTVLSAVCAVEN